MAELVEATCKQNCFDSPTSRYFEEGKQYEVDPGNPWVQRHFDVPKPSKADKAAK